MFLVPESGHQAEDQIGPPAKNVVESPLRTTDSKSLSWTTSPIDTFPSSQYFDSNLTEFLAIGKYCFRSALFRCVQS